MSRSSWPKGILALSVVLCLLAGLGLTGCSKAEPTEPAKPAPGTTPQTPGTTPTTPRPEDVFVGLVRHHPQTCDPAIGSDNPTRKYLIAVYEPLVRVEPGGSKLEPVLAESWSVSSDGLTYTFKLRSGVKFHDGSTLDAEAVKVSMERMKEIGLGNAWALKPVKEIKTVDPLTVDIILDAPHAPFLDAVPLVWIVSAAAVKEHAIGNDLAQDWLKENGAGTGPYKLVEWVHNEHMTLVKHDDYWRGWEENQFDKLILRRVEEGSTQRMMMEAGQADWIDTVQIDDLTVMMQDNRFNSFAEPSLTLFYLMMNTNKPPLDNVKVRQAMRYAFDYATLQGDIMKGLAQIPSGYLPPQYAAHDGGPEEAHDLEKAKQLLAEAGYPNGGFTLDLMYFSPLDWERMGSEMLVSALAKLNVKLEIEGLPWASMMTKFMDPSLRPHFAFFSATGTTSSPDSVFGQTFYSVSKHWSQYGYSNPEVDALVTKAQNTVDEAARNQIYKELQQILREDSPGINTVIGTANHVFKGSVKGFTLLTFMPDIVDYYLLYRED